MVAHVSPLQQEIERLNRARDFFGDPKERWDNRLNLERHTYLENYRCGRAALVLHCEFPVPMVADLKGLIQSQTGRLIHVKSATEKCVAFFIFKAKIVEPHKLQHWDDKFVFVEDIQIVQGPDGVIPSLVGLYCFQDEVINSGSDLLLFQSTTKSNCEFIPAIRNWESSVLAWFSLAFFHDSMPENIKAAPKVMESVSDNESQVCRGKSKLIENESHVCKLPAIISIDDNGVEVIRTRPLMQHGLNVMDVLVGPVNLVY